MRIAIHLRWLEVWFKLRPRFGVSSKFYVIHNEWISDWKHLDVKWRVGDVSKRSLRSLKCTCLYRRYISLVGASCYHKSQHMNYHLTPEVFLSLETSSYLIYSGKLDWPSPEVRIPILPYFFLLKFSVILVIYDYRMTLMFDLISIKFLCGLQKRILKEAVAANRSEWERRSPRNSCTCCRPISYWIRILTARIWNVLPTWRDCPRESPKFGSRIWGLVTRSIWPPRTTTRPDLPTRPNATITVSFLTKNLQTTQIILNILEREGEERG